MKYILLILLAAHCSLFTAYASVFMGGEITWQCLNNGRYRFFMKLYKECGGTNLAYGQVEVMEIINYPALGQTTKVRMGRVSITDDSPVCNAAGPGISCATATLPDKGTVSEYLYSTDSLNPTGYTLSGVPPSEGWIFTYKSPIVSSVTWKRNPSANIQKSDLLTWGLRAIMYPYEGRNADPCYDNSPTFAEKPSTVICTGYPFTYNPNAWDHELDSLVYDWAPPLDSNLSPITSYFPNYSFNSPLPGPAIDTRNVAATINHYTGQISFESFTPGAFVTVSKVSAYKNNILVAEIYREMQIVLLDCGSNKPPVITPPFISKKTGLPAFIDTVYAGQLVKFNLTATDSATQTLTMNASGPDFDPTSIGLSVQCLTPPCATLSPVLPLSGKATISTSFNWQTTCNDLIHKVIVGTDNPNLIYNHPVQSNVHNFVISTQDDFCSVPGKNVSTITVVVLNQPSLPPPSLRCISVNNATGDNTLTWLPITDTSNSFISYNIYYSLNPFGTYSLLSTINDQLTTTFTHVGANGNKQPVYYYMQTKCSCVDTLSIHGDTLSSMFLSLGPSTSVANLSWNPLHPINYQLSTINYVIWREHPIGKWSKLDSITINDQRSTINYNDTIAICTDSINYRIEVTDKSGCTSVSSVAGKQFKDNTAPDVPVLDTVSIDSISKKAIITWHVDPSKDTKKYILYEKINGVWSIVDTIVGRNSTYVLYKKDKFNPYSASEQFCLSAQDSCNNLSPISQNQNTLFLTLAPDICKNAISLSWNSVTPGFSQGRGTLPSQDTAFMSVRIMHQILHCYQP